MVVIGKSGRRIEAADAPAHIAGFTVAHDVSARDLQFGKQNGGQWLIGKSIDGCVCLTIGRMLCLVQNLPRD